jgi:hypothetical protein
LRGGIAEVVGAFPLPCSIDGIVICPRRDIGCGLRHQPGGFFVQWIDVQEPLGPRPRYSPVSGRKG